MTQKTMNQAAYARHRGISPARVSILIRDGKIPSSCYETEPNGRRLIDAPKADQALMENLDQVYNRRRGPDPAQIKAQEAAADFASEDEDCELWDRPMWELRFLVKLFELCPDLIEITRHDETIYEILVTDIGREGDCSKWSIDLNFTMGIEQ